MATARSLLLLALASAACAQPAEGGGSSGDGSTGADASDAGVGTSSSSADELGDDAPGASSSTSADTSASNTGSDDGDSDCAEQEQQLLDQIAADFDAAAVDPGITMDPDATLLVRADDGRMFVHVHGDSAADRVYESASTSKWVTSAILLDLVDQGVLSLDTTTSELLSFWPAPGVSLRHLLAFTSGFDDEAPCINLPGSDFAACVEAMYEAGLVDAPPPGTVFHYSGSHMQFAGLMAIEATGAASWTEIFDDWRSRTGMFPTGAYDLPSATNPRLAGGMHWRGDEYLEFLRALHEGELLSEDLRDEMLSNQRGRATVEASPALGFGEDWAYGLGNWLECSTATSGPGSYDCGEAGERNSSAGAYGAYPLIDAEAGFVAMLARQGGLASGGEGVALFRSVAPLVGQWAALDCG